MARWTYRRSFLARRFTRDRSLSRRRRLTAVRKTTIAGWCLLVIGIMLMIWQIAGLAARLIVSPPLVRPLVTAGSAHSTARAIAAAQITLPIVPASPDLGPVLPVAGLPSLPATAIDGILAAYASPLQGYGKVVVSLSEQYQIDDAVALAFFVMESRAGTQGEAVLTHSFGNLRPMPNQPALDGYRYYKTWLDGVTEWFQVMRSLYLNQMKLVNVEDIVPLYAPSVDSNDPAIMTSGIRQLVSCWRGNLDACPDDPSGVPGVVQAYRKALLSPPMQGPLLPRSQP
jgi:hypothetical protein